LLEVKVKKFKKSSKLKSLSAKKNPAIAGFFIFIDSLQVLFKFQIEEKQVKREGLCKDRKIF
jgi:hypothetical protein